ncbi:MAG: glycosyltransferase family 4 protein [Thermoproteus sp.]
MSRERLLVVAERYYPEGGGGELATHLIVGILRRRFDVTVVTGTADPERASGVRYVHEPLLSRAAKPVLWTNLARLARKGRFEALLRESDAVYIPRFAYPVIPRAKALGKRVVVHLHGYAPLSYTAVVLAPYEMHRGRLALDDISVECGRGLLRCAAAASLWWLPRLARRWIAQSDAVLCVSGRHAEIIRDGAPELSEKIQVVRNPLPPLEVERRIADVPTFLYLGGDDPLKGFPAVLSAIRTLGRRGIRARFLLANSYGRRAAEALRKVAGPVEVSILGRIPRQALAGLYAEAWALLFPSVWEEPSPYAVLEAAASGVVPVASRVGGVPEILAGTPAERYMGPPGDVAAQVAEVAGLTPEEAYALGREVREAVRSRYGGAEADVLKAFG